MIHGCKAEDEAIRGGVRGDVIGTEIILMVLVWEPINDHRDDFSMRLVF
jgi:hypothetical protein